MTEGDGGTDNEAHELVSEAYELAEQKLEKGEVTAEDVLEVGAALEEACEHPEADIWVTMTAEGFKNACDHHKYPDGPYEYEPVQSPRATLREHVDHEIEVTVS